MTIKEFEKQFNRLYLPLGMFALRIVGSADDAEDVVQSAFVKVWQQIADGHSPADFKFYIYRVVRNESLSFIRRRQETAPIDNDAAPEVDDESVDTSERDARLWRAIDELPERCRTIFLMSKRDGLTNDEIAEELGLSVKTVKNQMTKAFSRLREALADNRKPFFLPFL